MTNSIRVSGYPKPARDNPSKASASKGFTLVELLVGAALSATVLLAVLASYTYLGRSLARLANQQILGAEARRTMGYFTQDVRKATGLTDTANLSANRVSLAVPTSTGNTTITYYYNSTPISGSTVSDNVTVNGSSVPMQRQALTRCIYDGSTVTSLTLLNNITSSGLTLRYYDASGSEYLGYTNYLPGIKQLALQAEIQRGYAQNGTLTQAHQISTGRLTLRNRGFAQ